MTVRDGVAGALLVTCVAAISSTIPASPALLAVAATLALLIYVRTSVPIPGYTIWCASYLSFAAASALSSGMPASEFLNYDFYRYDGNVFVSFIPFLLAPALVGHRIPLLRSTRTIVLGVSILLFTFQVIAPAALFKSHNALGGFVSVILVTNVVLLHGALMWIALLLNVGSLLLSDSRGSLLGVIIACGVLLLYRRGWQKLAYASIFAGVGASIAIAVFGYHIWTQMGSPQILDIDEFSQGMEIAQQAGLGQVGDVANSVDRGSTIAHRVFFIWPVAIDDFLSSPIVGIGFGRFDDLPAEMHGIRGVVMLNETDHIQHTDAHAHNSYLHVAAETGVVGLALIVCLLVSLWKESDQLERPYCNVVKGLLLYVIFSSCTEHRLTTPAQMVPAASLMVMFLSCATARAVFCRATGHVA